MSSDWVNIAACLPDMAAKQPFKPAIIFPHNRGADGQILYSHYTYRQLNDLSDQIAAGLQSIGIQRGTRTVLMVKPSLEFFALTFAIFKLGAVPVLVDPGLGLKSLKKCLDRAEPEAFIGIPKAHLARLLFGWGKKTIRAHVTVGRKLFWGGHTLEQVKTLGAQGDKFELVETKADEIAAILFTSGSTGPPKGVVYRHGNFKAQVDMLREMFGIEPGEIDLPTFPLFALFDPALGMTTIVPDMDPTRPAEVDPTKIIEAIEDFGVTTMFGSPALLNTVSRYGEQHGIQLPTLKRVISAGAPVPKPVMKRFHGMLTQEACIYPPYGATESLPVAVLSSHEILSETWEKTEQGSGVCVGYPVKSIEVQVIGITDDPIEEWSEDLCLPKGEIGEVVVKGPQVTESYYNDTANTALSKIADGKNVRHRMGDLGYLDSAGRLWFCGRKAHRVQTPSETLFTVPCEAIFNTHPSVYRTALVGVPEGSNLKPVLCVELEKTTPPPSQEVVTRELRELAKKFGQTHNIESFFFHPGFPVDIRHNAKIGREALAKWVEEKTL